MKKILLTPLFILFLLTLLLPVTALGADPNGWNEGECKAAGHRWYQNVCVAEDPTISLQIPISGFTSGPLGISTYIKMIYQFVVAATAILAVIVIIIGGFLWMTAGGNQERVTAAKDYITGALVGLVLALGSFTVLKIVNPSLVFFPPLRVPVTKGAYMNGACPMQAPKGANVTFADHPETKVLEGEELKCGINYLTGDGSNKSPCAGVFCKSNTCLPKLELDNKTKSPVMDCQIPSDVCKGLNADTVKKINWPASQSACDNINTFTSANFPTSPGKCAWVGKTWLTSVSKIIPFLGTYITIFNSNPDGCQWCPAGKLKELQDAQATGDFSCGGTLSATAKQILSSQESIACYAVLCPGSY